MRYLVLLVLLSVLSSCSMLVALPGHGWRVTSERLREPFEQAAEEWCVMSEGRFCPYLDDGADQEVGDGSGHSHARGHCGWRGTYPRLDGTRFELRVNLRAVRAGDCEPVGGAESELDALRSILAHELGHTAGLRHLPDGTDGVMAEPQGLHVTAADAAGL